MNARSWRSLAVLCLLTGIARLSALTVTQTATIANGDVWNFDLYNGTPPLTRITLILDLSASGSGVDRNPYSTPVRFTAIFDMASNFLLYPNLDGNTSIFGSNLFYGNFPAIPFPFPEQTTVPANGSVSFGGRYSASFVFAITNPTILNQLSGSGQGRLDMFTRVEAATGFGDGSGSASTRATIIYHAPDSGTTIGLAAFVIAGFWCVRRHTVPRIE